MTHPATSIRSKAGDSKGPYWSYELDVDDDNISFSQELYSFPLTFNFVP